MNKKVRIGSVVSCNGILGIVYKVFSERGDCFLTHWTDNDELTNFTIINNINIEVY